MSVNLSVRPRRNRGGRTLFILLLILGVAGGLAWHFKLGPEQIMAQLEQNLPKYVLSVFSSPAWPLSPPAQAAQAEEVEHQSPDTVTLIDTQVINSPHSEAQTAILYNDTGDLETIPWPNIAGRTSVLTYTVESGDTLWSIANQFELDLDTLRWSNPELERNPDVLSVGTELSILPVQGVYHRITAEDSLESIAARYGVAETDITNYPPNGLYPPYDLKLGQGLIVPFGRKDVALPKPLVSAEYVLAWPVVSAPNGTFSPDHPAIDIGAPYGATVYAANGGKVIFADWSQDGLGYTVIIDHGDEFQTWYAHLKGTFLQAGDLVARGAPLGEVGSTGHSSGPHVHFELHLNGERVDPLDYLPNSPQ